MSEQPTIRLPSKLLAPSGTPLVPIVTFGLEPNACSRIERMIATATTGCFSYVIIDANSNATPLLAIVNGGSRTAMRSHEAAAMQRIDIAQCPVVYLGELKVPSDAMYVVPSPVAGERLLMMLDRAARTTAAAREEHSGKSLDMATAMQNVRIVVGDMSLPTRVQLERILETYGGGRTCFHADCGQIEKAVAVETPDLLLLRTHYQDGSGYDLCARLKSNRQDKALLVAFLSSSQIPVDRSAANAAGADATLAKPLSAEAMVRFASLRFDNRIA